MSIINKALVSVFILSLIGLAFSDVQAQRFQEEDIVINGGIGIGTTFSTAGVGFGLPLGGGVEYGVADLETGNIGVGGEAGIVTSSFVNMYTIGAKGSYYFTELFDIDDNDLDVYGGLGLYYRGFSEDWAVNPGAYAAFHAGVRYYFADNIGGYAEIGNNWGWLNIGLAIGM